jgi:hypothetical protein
MKQLFQDFKNFINPYLMKALFYILLAKEKIEIFVKEYKVDLIYWSIVTVYAAVMITITIVMPGLARTIVCGVFAFIAGYIRFSENLYVDQHILNKWSNMALGFGVIFMLLGLFGL